eukprot:gnl/MRDRNA2_/MRDRNA2_37766_c0_seq1.p1 gnl/MRDRNA2_/MRDRNA2_37766_c0~~gnl/MRDRNA2_/MRDRNA2_37766_c0_seq1.p1  ORF type:complete len:331 (+),score=71.71 gnl/MRDRNA2_/MRDRNA2_37766_c0_seq1:112-1104(+)
MEASSKLQTPLLQMSQTTSPRGSKQQHQRGFLPRASFQPTQGKSRCWDLVHQVDECNMKVEKLLRTGEATISASTFDVCPVSSESYQLAEKEEGNSFDRSSEEASWEDLHLAADSVLSSLGEQVDAKAEFSSFTRTSSSSSSSSQSSAMEGELELESQLKRSSSNGSQSTGLSALDEEEDSVEIKTLDCFDDEQLTVDRQCIRGHDLTPHRVPSNMWWCSKCLKQVQKGTRLFACRLCNYDECWSCVSAAQAKVRATHDSASSTLPREVLAQEVASLQRQMSSLQDQLHGAVQERDAEIAKNRRHQVTIACRLWRASWSDSDLSSAGSCA